MIRVIISKSKQCNPLLSPKSAYISFSYNENLINFIKLFRYRKWDPDTKTWEIQFEDLKTLISAFPKEKFDVLDLYKAPEKEILNKSIPENYNFYEKPFKHQIEGITYGINHPKFLLADEMGLGKSFQSLHIAKLNTSEKGKVLIICCSAVLKQNWKVEVNKTLGEEGYILGTRTKLNKKTQEVIEYEGNSKDKLEDLKNLENITNKYIITNRETIIQLKEKVGRSYKFPISEEINNLCKKGIIEYIIIDEFHSGFRNQKGISSKSLLKITDCKNMIAMTGTPIMNTPLDLYVMLYWLGIIEKSYTFWDFKNTFAELDDWGRPVRYKNLDKLSKQLNNNMLRRLKQDCLDLPDKIYIDEYVDMSKAQWNLYNIVRQELRDNLNTMIYNPSEPLAKLINLRKVTGLPTWFDENYKDDNAKMIRLKELVDQIIESGHKVVIFSNWSTVTSAIKDELSAGYNNIAYITGEIPDDKRFQEVEKFQNNDNCKIFIGTIASTGVGITLTAADYCIFYDLPWTNGVYQQCVDRLHRIGQKNKVTIYKLMCKNTIDERVMEIIENKGKMSKYVVDGQIDRSSYKGLLGELLK